MPVRGMGTAATVAQSTMAITAAITAAVTFALPGPRQIGHEDGRCDGASTMKRDGKRGGLEKGRCEGQANTLLVRPAAA